MRAVSYLKTATYALLATAISPGSLPQGNIDKNTVPNILQIVFGIIGALALTMITVSGLRYILSAGNPDRASRARNGIIYALVGLAIAISAEAIVTFVGSRL